MKKTSDKFIRDHIPVYENNTIVGKITSSVYSPRLKKNIGLAIINKKNKNSKNLKIEFNNQSIKVEIAELPFLRNK